MFSNQSFEPVDFKPTATAETSSTSEQLQTDELKFKEADVQTLQKRDAEAQTSSKADEESNVDYDKLAAFLRRVTPNVLQSLEEIYDNNAIDEYESQAFKDPVPQVKLLTRFSTLEAPNTQKKISAIQWSINGGTLAVAYGAINHDTWCNHQSHLKLYEFTRHDTILDTPTVTYETNACVVCLSYHPTEPSILAAGLSSGDVVIWNLTDSTTNTPILVCVHSDVVTSLQWRPKTIRDPPLLVSTSADGYILMDKIIENFTDSALDRRFKIVKEYNPAENGRPPSAGSRQERASEAGLNITCLDLSVKNLEIFIVGTLCGAIYKCNINATSLIQGDKSLIDPVIDEFERSDSSITSVKCSPTLDILVSSNTNKEIRIFNINEAISIHIIPMEYTITGLQWYMDARDIILAYGANSTVKFFHASNGTTYHDLKIQSQSNEVNNVDIMFKRDAVALSDLLGNVEVWKIPKGTYFPAQS